MKKRLGKSALLKDTLIFTSLFLMIISGTGCIKGPNPGSNQQQPKLLTELVVWLKPGVSRKEFNVSIDSLKRKYGDIVVKYTCKSCDSSLMLLTGRGIEIWIQGDPPVARGGKMTQACKLTGDQGKFYTSFNYPISIDTIQKIANATSSPAIAGYSEKPTVKVAVIDTGIDTSEFKGYLYRNSTNACIPGANWGWNFVDSNANFTDTHEGKHGTTVGRMIVDEVIKYKRNPVEILPIKAHGSSGKSDLYSVLCAFAYAKERGVHIINESSGFYTPRLDILPAIYKDRPIKLTKEYIKYYLTQNNILLVAAAGNKDDVGQRDAFEVFGLDLPASPGDRRNLDIVSFYPASLARDTELPNVIAVTTVSAAASPPPRVSPKQNYSAGVVDIGVQADTVLADDQFVFFNPRTEIRTRTTTVHGSSFATPIVTGKLSAFFSSYSDLLVPGRLVNKHNIISILISKGVVTEQRLLLDTISEGQVTKRF